MSNVYLEKFGTNQIGHLGSFKREKKMLCISVQWSKMCLHICLTKRFHFLFWIFSQGFKNIYKLRRYYSMLLCVSIFIYIYKRCHCSLYQSSWWDLFGFVWLCFWLFLQVFVCCFLLYVHCCLAKYKAVDLILKYNHNP